MAPMATWSGNADGTVSEPEIDYYHRRVNGVGLVLTGCSPVQPNGTGIADEFAAYDDRFVPSLARLAEAAKAGGALALLEIFHAGSKALPGSDIVSASAVPTQASPFAVSVTPRALSEMEILETIHAFGAATRRALAAGFDGIELHGAQGFLIQNFLSPRSNRRTDDWGALDKRMRFPLVVVAEVKRIARRRAGSHAARGRRRRDDRAPSCPVSRVACRSLPPARSGRPN